jgi:peptide/nickel transport system permease protein
MEFGGVIAFAVVTESVFSWPGAGKMLIDAIAVLDRPLIVAYLIFVVAMFVALNLLVDIVYSLLDPRVRVGSAA